MRRRSATSPAEIRAVLVETWAANERMNQLVLEHLDARAWRAKPPGANARPIAVIFAHVHNVRRKWLRLTAPHLRLPAELDRTRCTQKQVRSALAASAVRCSRMLAEGLTGPEGRIETFRRDGWMTPWPAGPTMFAYMFAHEAHHRGQVLLLAHQLGFPLPMAASNGIWQWDTLWKACGFTTRPR